MEPDQENYLQHPSESFRYKQASFEYIVYGHGPKTILAFHGFGQEKKYFSQIAASLHPTCTLISFDLPFHGNSNWYGGDSPLHPNFFTEAIGSFLSQKKIDRFSTMGFSMGGKFALTIAKSFPEKIDHLVLMAPDGIKTSFWYSMATYPTWIRGIFRRTIVKPAAFAHTVNVIHRLGLLDKSLIKFAKFQMNTKAKRRQVYFSWTVFRLLKINTKELISALNLNNVHTTIFFGKYDKMIDKKEIVSRLKDLKKLEIIDLESGHSQMLENVAAYLSTKNTITCPSN